MKGICGLGNVGNSCYINASLQILSQIHELNDYLLTRDKLRNIPDTIIAFEWINLFKMIQQNHCSIFPHRFLDKMRHTSIQKNRKEFASREQNDSVDYFSFILDCIHNSLNLLDPDIRNDRINHSVICDYLDKIEVKDRSMVQKLFLSCSIYQYIHPITQKLEFYKIEHDQIIGLSIPETDIVSLSDCFVETFKEEIMTGDNEWFDEKENRKKTVLKRSALCYTPPILILHLKRWRSNLSKHNVKIDTPLLIDLQKFTIYKESCPYELFGIINHEGSNQGGHYYSYIKKEGEWYSINDHFIQSISLDQLIHESNYCLFYRKIK